MANRINDKQPRDMATEDEMFRDTWADAIGGARWMLCIMVAGAVVLASLLFSGCSAAGDGYSEARDSRNVTDYDQPDAEPAAEPDSGTLNQDFGWCDGAGWPEVPRCIAAEKRAAGEQ